jgi:hypothetical protein
MYKPLQGDPGFDRGVAPVAGTDIVAVWLGFEQISPASRSATTCLRASYRSIPA